MGSGKRTQRHNLGSSVEDREEVPPYTVQNEKEKTHKLCAQRSRPSTSLVIKGSSSQSVIFAMSLISRKKPHLISNYPGRPQLPLDAEYLCTGRRRHPSRSPPWPMPQAATLYQHHIFTHGTLGCANLISFVRLTYWIVGGQRKF